MQVAFGIQTAHTARERQSRGALAICQATDQGTAHRTEIEIAEICVHGVRLFVILWTISLKLLIKINIGLYKMILWIDIRHTFLSCGNVHARIRRVFPSAETATAPTAAAGAAIATTAAGSTAARRTATRLKVAARLETEFIPKIYGAISDVGVKVDAAAQPDWVFADESLERRIEYLAR